MPGHLYVILFDEDATVKVGRSLKPEARIRTLACQHNGTPGRSTLRRVWVSQPHDRWVSNEERLIDWAMQRAILVPHCREMFYNLDFHEAVSYAAALDYTPLPPGPGFAELKRRLQERISPPPRDVDWASLRDRLLAGFSSRA